MDKKDLEQIKDIVEESTDKLALMIDKGFAATATKDYVDEKFEELDGKISQLPTKSYIDEKFAGFEGDIIVKLRKEDQKVNRLLELLKQKKLLTDSELADLASLEVFPKQS